VPIIVSQFITRIFAIIMTLDIYFLRRIFQQTQASPESLSSKNKALLGIPKNMSQPTPLLATLFSKVMRLRHKKLHVRISPRHIKLTDGTSFLFCTMTNKRTIISQIITLLHVSTLSCHPQGDGNFVLRPTNAQIFHKLSHCYMFRHYCDVQRELVILY